jgi:ATP-dependent RNA helicase RhlE
VCIAPVAETTNLVEQSVCFVKTPDKRRVLVQFIKTRSIERALVFTRTKRGADRVVRDLENSGIRSAAIHGNKSQSNRQRALDNFKSRRTPILIATDIAARGIDVEGISHVVNYDLPHEPETYVHRIGRTGRAGASGSALSFCDQAECGLLTAIERLTRQKLAVEKSLPVDSQIEQASQSARPATGNSRGGNGQRRKPSNRRGRRPQSHERHHGQAPRRGRSRARVAT